MSNKSYTSIFYLFLLIIIQNACSMQNAEIMILNVTGGTNKLTGPVISVAKVDNNLVNYPVVQFVPEGACSQYTGNATIPEGSFATVAIRTSNNDLNSYSPEVCSPTSTNDLTFVTKIDNAIALGASLLIIGDDEGSMPMPGDVNSAIPVIMVSSQDYQTFKQLLVEFPSLYIDVDFKDIEDEPFFLNFKYATIVIAFMGITFVGFFAASYLWKRRYLNRLDTAREMKNIATTNERENAIEELPIVKYKKPSTTSVSDIDNVLEDGNASWRSG